MGDARPRRDGHVPQLGPPPAAADLRRGPAGLGRILSTVEPDDDGQQIGYKVLPRGTPVLTSDGVEFGKVARVLDNEREHIFDGLVVRGSERTVFVDAPEVARITEKRVTLTIDAAQAAELPEHHGWRGAVQHRARRRMDRIKRRLPGR